MCSIGNLSLASLSLVVICRVLVRKLMLCDEVSCND